MKKLFFNKKFLFIIGLFALFMLINCNEVHAESIIVTSETYNKSFIDSHIEAGQSPFDGFKKIVDHFNKTSPGSLSFTSSDLPKYGLLFKISGTRTSEYREEYLFIFSSVPVYFNHSHCLSVSPPQGDTGLSFLLTFEDHYEYYATIDAYGLTFNETDLVSSTSGIRSLTTHYNATFYGGGSFITLASNYDLLYEPNGEVVFQQPTLRKATTLAPVIQREKTKGTLQVVLKEIIQILPLILLVVVSLIGLRKALKMLFQLLRRS